MRNQKMQVAIIDIGSSKIEAVVGERGVNHTFIIKGEQAFNYEGFCVGEIFDLNGFKSAIENASKFIKKTIKSGVNQTVYVGVPTAFTKVVVRDSQISFPKKKKITEQDIDKLFDAAFVPQSNRECMINRSAIVFELDDYRRLANPLGNSSEILKGKLSFVLCDNKIIDIIRTAIKIGSGFNAEFVPTSLAEAMYLVGAETRDRIAEILDVGHITTTFSIIQGDGILFEKAIDFGGGFITGALSQELDVSFEEAENLKKRINLSKLTESSADFIDGENGQYYNIEQIKKIIKESIDGLCEQIALAIDESGYAIPEYVKLMITGGGLVTIRGAKEHLSDRLGMIVEVLSPKVPLMESPLKSSTLSLLDIGLSQNN